MEDDQKLSSDLSWVASNEEESPNIDLQRFKNLISSSNRAEKKHHSNIPGEKKSAWLNFLLTALISSIPDINTKMAPDVEFSQIYFTNCTIKSALMRSDSGLANSWRTYSGYELFFLKDLRIKFQNE